MLAPAVVVRKAPKASCGTTCCEGVAEAAFLSWAGRQAEAKGPRQGQEAPAASDQAGAETAAQAGQPEASAVQEEEQILSPLLVVCFGLQGSVCQQMPEHGSAGH